MPVDAALILRSARSAERLRMMLLLSKLQLDLLRSTLEEDPDLWPELSALEKKHGEVVEGIDRAVVFLEARHDAAQEGP